MTPRPPRDLRARRLVRSVVPPALARLILPLADRRVARWDHALAHLRETQERQLRRIVRGSRGAERGRALGFDAIDGYESWRRRVPLTDYDALEPAFARIRAGARGVLTTNRTRYVCNSAGSSEEGRQKFLPVADAQIPLQRAAGVDAVLRHLAHTRDGTFLEGFTLSVLPPIILRREGPITVTNNPALMMAKMPPFGRLLYLPDARTAAIPDIDGKIEALAERYLDHDVRTVTGTTCWFAVLFDALLAAARRRGRHARHVCDLWPNLEFLVGGGVAAEPYLPVLRERLGRDDVQLVDTYNATEGGIFAVSDHASGEEGMLLVPDRGVFFELVPLRDAGRPTPERLPIWEAQRDVDYVLHVSTVSGLHAYRLGDIVRFTSTAPPRLVFSGRLSGCLSTTQELTTHAEVQAAMRDAAEEVPCSTVDYAVGARYGAEGTAKARYVIYAEFLPGRAPADADAFVSAFDASHRRRNRAYREHRERDTAILPPVLVTLPPGSVDAFLRAGGRGGVQSKFPRIVEGARQARLEALAGGAHAAR